jgi:hypothetical protein
MCIQYKTAMYVSHVQSAATAAQAQGVPNPPPPPPPTFPPPPEDPQQMAALQFHLQQVGSKCNSLLLCFWQSIRLLSVLFHSNTLTHNTLA